LEFGQIFRGECSRETKLGGYCGTYWEEKFRFIGPSLLGTVKKTLEVGAIWPGEIFSPKGGLKGYPRGVALESRDP